MKRLIAIITAILLPVLPVQTAADSKAPLSYDRAVSLLKLNSNTLKRLQRAENDACKQYRINSDEFKNKDVNGFTIVFNDKEYYITYGAETRQALAKMKELVPAQMEFSWEAAKANRIITENTLKTSLRGLFLGLYTARNDVMLKQKQLSLATEINRQDVLKLKKGLITPLDLDESDYNLLKAQKDLEAAKRSYQNAVRSFNQFVGLPSETEYTQIVYEEPVFHPELKPVDYYMDAALANRFDIVSLRKQLDLKELDRKLTEAGYTYKIDTNEQDAYERLINDIDGLKLDIEGMKLSITDEIRNAYADIISAGKALDSMYNTVKLQQSNYEKMQERYKVGMIAKNVLDQAEIGLLQAENGYKSMLFDYNTRVMRLNNATGIGPGY